MTTDITVNNNQDGTIWFVLKPDTEVVVGRHYEDKRMMIQMSLPESDVLKMRDYLNEKYPVKHDTTDSHRLDEPNEIGLYITQSGKTIVKDNCDESACWNYIDEQFGGLRYCSWNGLINKLGESEFPLRKAKAVAE